ncbi:MAG: hypothetical protein HWE16_05355 [Gammaproteobacteria bacterium]|nr:hypothetical protein [Gammaproteobacteria bacterium]
MQNQVLQYHGRVPKRAGSLAKRDQILQATLDIIYREGLRGVRHRAVAEEADVPLSATTYYFQDINVLIVDSFVFFMEKNLGHQLKVFEGINLNLSNLLAKNLAPELVRDLIKNNMVAYLKQQISDHEARVIERSFIQYAARVPVLAEAVNQIRSYFFEQIKQILISIGAANAEFKAELILAFLHYSEENSVLEYNVSPETAQGVSIDDKVESLLALIL